MEVIGSISFFQEDGRIKSQSDFDLKYFNGNLALAQKIMEGLHYDFIFRMKEESLIDLHLPQQA